MVDYGKGFIEPGPRREVYVGGFALDIENAQRLHFTLIGGDPKTLRIETDGVPFKIYRPLGVRWSPEELPEAGAHQPPPSSTTS